MIRVFRVTMIGGDCWEGPSTSFNSAVTTACNVFLAPPRAVVSVEVLKRFE